MTAINCQKQQQKVAEKKFSKKERKKDLDDSSTQIP